MSRRSRPQSDIDRQAWPITLRVLVPDEGMIAYGVENDIHRWLRDEIGLTEHATTTITTPLIGQAIEVHLRRQEHLEMFMTRFPDLKLADGTISPLYRSPILPFGRKEQGGF